MSDLFSAALIYVLKNEGGFINDAVDRGGATNMGVTLLTLAAWRSAQGKPPPVVEDVRNLSVAEASAIYRASYWDKVGLSQLTSGPIATVLFDVGVLNGPKTAITYAQTVAAGVAKMAITADGSLGPKTATAINACRDRPFIQAMQLRLMRRYLDICLANPAQAKFFDGWAKRCLAYDDLVPSVPTVAVS